jgi:HEPN domain-containing protein
MMIAKTEYWLELCDDDLLTAKALFQSKRYLHMGFFCHLIVEKALKAVIAYKTDEIPPRLHDLVKLASKGEVFDIMSDDQKQFLHTLTPLQIEARYPEYKERILSALTPAVCKQLLKQTEEFLCWTKQQLEK